MLLTAIIETYDERKLSAELDLIGEKLSLLEGVEIVAVDDSYGIDELSRLFHEAVAQLNAAKRGIGIANKLKAPEERKKHRSAIMSNMNKLRGLVARIDRKIKSITGKED